jgi:hypothetical protein
MTVLRREDVQSRVASWDVGPYRIASSPILTIVPLIIRRLRGPSLTCVVRYLFTLVPVTRCWLVRRLERRPQEADQFPRDRHHDLGRGLVVFRQPSESPTQALLRVVGNR